MRTTSRTIDDILDLHQELSSIWSTGKQIDISKIKEFISIVIQGSSQIKYIEDRETLRSILHFWGNYMTTLGQKFPDIDIDSPDRRPTEVFSIGKLSSKGEMRLKLNRTQPFISLSEESLRNDLYRKFKNIFEYLLSMNNPAIERREFNSWYVHCPDLEEDLRQTFTDITSSSRLLIGYTGMGKSTLIRYVFNVKSDESPSVINDKHFVIPFFYTMNEVSTLDICMPFINKSLAYAAEKLKAAKCLDYEDSEFVNYIVREKSIINYLTTSQRALAPKEILSALENIDRTAFEITKLQFLLDQTDIKNVIIVVDDIESLRSECMMEIVFRTLHLYQTLLKDRTKYEIKLIIACRPSTISILARQKWFTAVSFPRSIEMNSVIDLCALFNARFESAVKRLKREAWIQLEALPSEVRFPIELIDKVRYENSAKLLFFRGIMSKKEKDILYDLSENPIYKKAIDKLYKESDKIIGNLDTWEEALNVLNNISNKLCRRFSNQIVLLHNYNIRDAIREFQLILTNRRWLQKDAPLDSSFKLSEYNFVGTEIAIYRTIGLRESTIYPGKDTPIANLLWNQTSKESDLLLSYVIRWFLNKEADLRGKTSLWKWNDIIPTFEKLFDIEKDILKNIMVDIFEYMMNTGSLIHTEIRNPGHGEQSLQLTPRAKILWKMLEVNSLFLEFYRDDTYQVFKGRNPSITSELSGNELYVELLTICNEIARTEYKHLKYVRTNNLISKFKDSFGVELLSARILRGICNSVKTYFRGSVPQHLSRAIEMSNNLAREAESMLI